MWLAVRAGHAFPILVPCMSCPVVDGRQWRRFKDAHASCSRHALLPRGLNPWKGRRRENSENALRFFTFINYIGWKFFINTLKKLTKLRPHGPSVMFSTPPVAPKSCDSNWFFIWSIFYFTHPPWTKSSECGKRTNLAQEKSPTNLKLITQSVFYLVKSLSFTFLSFFPSIVGRNSNICKIFQFECSPFD